MAVIETLGSFLVTLMRQRNLSNRELARLAEVSEGAIRNLVKYGDDPRAKDPDPRTLSKVAVGLGIDPIVFFRLANYIPPSSQRILTGGGIYFAQVFDKLPSDKQKILLSVAEALSENVDSVDSQDRASIKALQGKPFGPLHGSDLIFPGLIRQSANYIMLSGKLFRMAVEDLEVRDVPPDAPAWTNPFGELPENMQQRIVALIRAKYALDFDPSMVDDRWRY